MEVPRFKRLRLESACYDITEDDEQEIAFPGGLSMADPPPAAAAAAAAAAATAAFPPFDERVLAAAAAVRQREAAAAAAAVALGPPARAARPRRVLAAERIEAIRVRIRNALRVHARGYGRQLAERYAHDDLVRVKEFIKMFRVPGEDISRDRWWKYQKMSNMADNELGLEYMFALSVENGFIASPCIIEAYRGRLALLPGCE